MQKIEVYTEQEKEFLIKVLDLFNISYTTEEINHGISCTLFNIDNSDTKAVAMVGKCMAFNYERNFCR